MVGWYAGRLAAVVVAMTLGAACSSPATGGLTAPLGALPASATTTATSTTTTTTATPTTEAEVATTVTEVVAISFAKKSIDDGALATGKSVLRTAGRQGSKTVTWLVRTRGGVEVGRTLSSEKVTKAPVDEVTAVGTKVAAPPAAPTPTETTGSGCDPNYTGACVPVASDVDCAGGKGNGPAYVRGPVQVVGTDIYGLDADHDGIGCE
ncbi:MAG: G5 domain-containing protein [Lapillicoccus sp.]